MKNEPPPGGDDVGRDDEDDDEGELLSPHDPLSPRGDAAPDAQGEDESDGQGSDDVPIRKATAKEGDRA